MIVSRQHEFKLGDRVVHPHFGLGVVTRCEEEGRVEVAFDHGGRKWLVLQYANLRLATDRDEAADVAALNDWRLRQVQAFEQEADDAEHFMGSHWSPFFDDHAIFKQLPSILPESLLMEGFSSIERYHPPYPPMFAWPAGFYLSWPRRQQGLLLALKVEAERNAIVSLYPYVGLGTEQSIEIHKVRVWESGLEAQIEASIEGAGLVTFFDPLFAINRGWYAAGERYQFVLTGIAYDCRLAQDHPFTLEHSSVVLEHLRERAAAEGWEEPAPVQTIHTQGMAMLLPIDE